ncbi:MAG TPA: hypothetical protein VG964_00815 [Candidatus Saccharimonadales bacterium]|nr:hypothetical protein [Candidatus Saccharimonadales bacterium]
MNKKQSGFAVVELIIIILYAVVICVGGYGVWHNEKNKNKPAASTSSQTSLTASTVSNFDDCSKASGSKIQQTFPEICVTADGKSFTQDVSRNSSSTTTPANSGAVNTKDTQPATKQKYLTITEWGVHAPYTSSSLTLQYKMETVAGIKEADITSAELLKAGGSDCIAGGGAVARYSGSDSWMLPDGTSDGTIANAVSKGDIVYYSKVGNYYYVFTQGQAACADPSIIGSLQTDTLALVKQTVTKLTAE